MKLKRSTKKRGRGFVDDLIRNTKRNIINTNTDSEQINKMIAKEDHTINNVVDNFGEYDEGYAWTDTFMYEKCESPDCYEIFKSNPILARKYNITKEYYNLKHFLKIKLN